MSDTIIRDGDGLVHGKGIAINRFGDDVVFDVLPSVLAADISDELGDGEICTEIAIRCENGVLITKFLRVKGTLSDTPCVGLGGGGMGGPPLGEGGPPPDPGAEWHWCHDPVTGWYLMPKDVPCPMSGGGEMAGFAGAGFGAPGFMGGGASFGGAGFGGPFLDPRAGNPNLPGGPLMPSGGFGGGVRGPGLAGGPMGGGMAMGGSMVLDPFPTGTSGQVISYDSGGNLTATTLTSSLGSLTPASIGATTNNYAPGAARLLRLSTTGAGGQTITGLNIGQVDCQMITIANIDTVDTITLTAEDAGSTAAYRFTNVDSTSLANIPIAANSHVSFIYDGAASRWRKL